MSYALEKAWGRHIPTTGVVQGAYSASFNTSGPGGSGSEKQDEYKILLKRVEEFEASEGRRPRILVAKMGQVRVMSVAKVYTAKRLPNLAISPLFIGWTRSWIQGHREWIC